MTSRVNLSEQRKELEDGIAQIAVQMQKITKNQQFNIKNKANY